jgi:capsid portal protein
VGYQYEGIPGFGRSRGGIMSEGGSWRVPPQYTGTLDDNFVTRALTNREKDIEKLLKAELRA